MNNPLHGLNEFQQQVVQTTAGPVLVLAGAGSGKTRALTHRIAYLVATRLARPAEILAVTFTNKAAGEMRERVARLVGAAAQPHALGTFHSLGARMLREQYRATDRSAHFTILDEGDSGRIMKRAMEEVGMSSKQKSPASVRAAISRAKNQGQLPADEVLRAVYEAYQTLLRRHDAYDFDDLLLEPITLLASEEKIRHHYQDRWRYISVDEYQDVNALQVRWLSLLVGRERNICAVGDDYQAIYSWRGADVGHLMTFEQQFPGCQTIILTQNYRSTPAVLTAANAVIAENVVQKHKKLWTTRDEGTPVRLTAMLSDRSEASFVRMQIQEYVRQGGALRDCAVLYRTNAQSRIFEEEFLTAEVPYMIVGGFRFYERREIKDALALLTLTVNRNALLPLQRVAEALWRGVGPKTLRQWEAAAQQEGVQLLDIVSRQAEARPVLQKIAQAYQATHNQKFATVADLLERLLTVSGYMATLKAQPDSEERLANITELLNVTSVYTDVTTFLETVALLTDIDPTSQGLRGAGRADDRVTCMTLHSAKGLEFSNVFLVGCEEGLLPHVNSLASREQLEEERRLLYVGMTRAKDQLTLSYAQYRFIRGQRVLSIPSRFLSALPETVERVETWGEGIDEESGSELIDYAVPEL